MSIFKMPKPVKVTGLSSSITKSFVGGIIPCINPTEEEIDQALDVLGMTQDSICCAYCGAPYTEWDHLNPLIRDRKPTGFISEIHNLVPACGKCNQSKGGKDWRVWIVSNAPLSPKTKGVVDLERRIKNLERYEKTFAPIRINFKEVVGEELWSEHWKNYQAVIDAMVAAQSTSDAVKDTLANAIKIEHKSNVTPSGSTRSSEPTRQTSESRKHPIRNSEGLSNVEASLNSIGKWFFIEHFEELYTWRGTNKKELVNRIMQGSCKKGYSGTYTSVTESLRLIESGLASDALEVIMSSNKVLRKHPETPKRIRTIISKYPELITS